MSHSKVEQDLLIGLSMRGQLWPIGGIAVALAACALLGVWGIYPGWLMWLAVAVFGTLLVIGVAMAARARRSSWELRLNGDGVTVRGHSSRPWSDFAEVRITGLRPRWFFYIPFGFRAVAFIPQPGVQLEALPSAKPWGMTEGWASSMRTRWYGSQLIVLPYAFDASAAAIAGAVRRFSSVPVRGA